MFSGRRSWPAPSIPWRNYRPQSYDEQSSRQLPFVPASAQTGPAGRRMMRNEEEFMPSSHWPAINEDVDAEFRYWKDQLVVSVGFAVVLALAAGFAIALWPQTPANAQTLAFAREFWLLLTECAFWLGFAIGLLRAALLRLASSMLGRLPWQ